MATISKQDETTGKISKKEFSKSVFARLTSSLADYNLKEKKLENRLKKVSKQLAADILKNTKDKAQAARDKAVETASKAPETRSRKKKAKADKKTVTAE